MFVVRVLLLASGLLVPRTAAFDKKMMVCMGSYLPLGQPPLAVTSADGLVWSAMEASCRQASPGYAIATRFDGVSEALCPVGSLVPVGRVNNDDLVKWYSADVEQPNPVPDAPSPSRPNATAPVGYTALLWPNTTPVPVAEDTTYRCAVCQMAQRFNVITQGVYPPHDNSIYEYDLQLVSNDRVDDLRTVASGSDLATRLIEELAVELKVDAGSLRWHGAEGNAEGKALVHVYYAPGAEDKMDWLFYVHWGDEYLKRVSVSNFELRLIRLSTECVDDKPTTFKIAKENSVFTGAIDITVALVENTLTSRECYWDAATAAARWSPPVVWVTFWTPCDMFFKTLFSIAGLRGVERANALRTLDLVIAFVLVREQQWSRVDFNLNEVVTFANTLLTFHVQDTSRASVSQLLSYEIPRNLADRFLALPLRDAAPSQLIHAKYLTLLASRRDPASAAPVTGLALTLPCAANNGTHAEQPIPGAASLAAAHIVVTVSESISAAARRLALVAYAPHLDTADTPMLDKTLGSWMALVQVAYSTDGAASAADFVDVAFRPTFREPHLRGKCVERLLATEEWHDGSCRLLRSPRDQMMVCRCTGLRREPHGNFTTGLYLVYGFDASLSTYLANHLTLIIVIAVVGAMTALGLASVVLTAVMFPEWRSDRGHQIFLQMVLALAVNLALGFVNNFVSVDTKSATCVAIGVVRHYSFLAMFGWMMVLSCLQVRRLTTIAGAKSTTHLMTKVMSIAWGLPLVPIVVLLLWDTGFYKSELSNRGYCYPEGVAFQATVQGPAAVILAANLVIFVVILNRIYGWCKCDKDVEVRKHTTDERAVQLRNLGNSIFIFFLFGFTWTFHFLSEEGIINSEFLFEYMFLITAAFHLLMLSLFFIVLDKKTRKLWKDALRC